MELLEWIETLIGEPVGNSGSGSGSKSGSRSGVEDLMVSLKSGVVLCRVVNVVKPGFIGSARILSSSSSGAFGAMDLVGEFGNACRIIGVKEQVCRGIFFLF